jgi:hypothetical protein
MELPPGKSRLYSLPITYSDRDEVEAFLNFHFYLREPTA